MPVAWVFNLDADDELRNPVGYQPSRAVLQRLASLARHLHDLLGPGDVIVESPPQRLSRAFVGQAWCPTPRALSLLRAAGVCVPKTPPLEVLQRTNHRGFCAKLGQTLPGAGFVHSVEEMRAHVSSYPADVWLLKRPYGFSGRGQHKVGFPDVDPKSLNWIQASFRSGEGLQIEPWVERELDCVVHGYVDEGGEIHLGQPVIQVCDERGAWVRTELDRNAQISPCERRVLLETARHTAQALVAAGYFGPFGIDAYRWRDASGRLHFNPRSDLNARYTMGWHIGMGGWRPGMSKGSEHSEGKAKND